MSFNPPPPPPNSGDDQPGSVPGYPGPGSFPPPPAGSQPGSFPQYPAGSSSQGVPQYPGGGPQYYGPREYPNGTLILILGIVGLIVCGPVGIAAWIMGNKAIKEIDSSSQVYSNRGVVQAGRILGIIATIFLILGTIAFVGLIATGGLMSFSNI